MMGIILAIFYFAITIFLSVIIAGFTGNFMMWFFILFGISIALFIYLAIALKKDNKAAKKDLEENGKICDYDHETRELILYRRACPALLKIVADRSWGVEKTPEKLHYGSVTVGGVTVGGTYVTGGQTVLTGGNKTGSYVFYCDGYNEQISKIELSPELYELAMKSSLASAVRSDRTLPIWGAKEYCQSVKDWLRGAIE